MLVYTNQGNRTDSHELDSFDLAEFAERLEAMNRSIVPLRARLRAGEILETSEGSWCRYCPSKHVCPSKNALIVQAPERAWRDHRRVDHDVGRGRAAYDQLLRVELLCQ